MNKFVTIDGHVFGPFTSEEASAFVEEFRATWKAKLFHGVGKIPDASVASANKYSAKEAVSLLWPPVRY